MYWLKLGFIIATFGIFAGAGLISPIVVAIGLPFTVMIWSILRQSKANGLAND